MFSLKMTLKEWLKYEMPLNEIIVNASLKDGSDSFLPFMIGIDARCKLDYLIKLFEDVDRGNINNKLYCQAFSINTDLKRRGRWGRNEQPIRRETIFSSLTEKGFSKTSNGMDFFSDLTKSKFIFSPEGNGIDCHRHYEAILFKGIPIVEDNSLIMEKYEGLPVLYTHDYSEIDEAYLDSKYNEMLDQTYDFGKLFLKYYDEEVKKEIIENSNYWVNKWSDRSGRTTSYPLDLSTISGCEKIYEEMCFLTITNSGYIEMTKNCIKSLDMLNFKHNLKVFCLDDDCKQSLEKEYEHVYLHDNSLKEFSSYNDNNWNLVNMKKVDIIRKQMNNYKYVLQTDGDIVFENPLFLVHVYKKIKQNENIDIYGQLEHPRSVICGGFYVIRSNENMLNLYDPKTLVERNAYEGHDQDYIMGLLQNKEINVGFFDRELFPNGNLLMYRGLRREPYMIHFNYITGYDTKLKKMKEFKKWYLNN